MVSFINNNSKHIDKVSREETHMCVSYLRAKNIVWLYLRNEINKQIYAICFRRKQKIDLQKTFDFVCSTNYNVNDKKTTSSLWYFHKQINKHQHITQNRFKCCTIRKCFFATDKRYLYWFILVYRNIWLNRKESTFKLFYAFICV